MTEAITIRHSTTRMAPRSSAWRSWTIAPSPGRRAAGVRERRACRSPGAPKGKAVADPFRRTKELLEMLDLRVKQERKAA